MLTNHHRHADNSSPPPKPIPVVLSLFLKPIIMLFYLSFFLFLSIAAVSLLLLLLAGSSLHRCRRCRSTAAAALPVEDLQKYFPRFNYDARLKSAKDYAVCLECFKEGEWCRRLPDCNHVFYLSCVDSWLTKVLNCPFFFIKLLLMEFCCGVLFVAVLLFGDGLCVTIDVTLHSKLTK